MRKKKPKYGKKMRYSTSLRARPTTKSKRFQKNCQRSHTAMRLPTFWYQNRPQNMSRSRAYHGRMKKKPKKWSKILGWGPLKPRRRPMGQSIRKNNSPRSFPCAKLQFGMKNTHGACSVQELIKRISKKSRKKANLLGEDPPDTPHMLQLTKNIKKNEKIASNS